MRQLSHAPDPAIYVPSPGETQLWWPQASKLPAAIAQDRSLTPMWNAIVDRAVPYAFGSYKGHIATATYAEIHAAFAEVYGAWLALSLDDRVTAHVSDIMTILATAGRLSMPTFADERWNHSYVQPDRQASRRHASQRHRATDHLVQYALAIRLGGAVAAAPRDLRWGHRTVWRLMGDEVLPPSYQRLMCGGSFLFTPLPAHLVPAPIEPTDGRLDGMVPVAPEGADTDAVRAAVTAALDGIDTFAHVARLAALGYRAAREGLDWLEWWLAECTLPLDHSAADRAARWLVVRGVTTVRATELL